MKRLNKKGFTIIELVIVIAVVAILAAVLIPTFTNVIAKANESSALQEARSIYEEALALDLADGEQDGFEGDSEVKDAGIDIDDFSEMTDLQALYYDGKFFITYNGNYFVVRDAKTGAFSTQKATDSATFKFDADGGIMDSEDSEGESATEITFASNTFKKSKPAAGGAAG